METEIRKCKFHDGIDVINVYDHQLEDDSPLSLQAGMLVRQHWNSKPSIVINVDHAARESTEHEFSDYKDYITFVEAHEAVHFLEDHVDGSAEEEFKADLYGTALCVIKGYTRAAAIGHQRLSERYDTEESVDTLLSQACADLQG
jgi:hypothetical protein